EVVGRGFVPVYFLSTRATGPQLRKIGKNVYRVEEENRYSHLGFIKPGMDGERPLLIDGWLNYGRTPLVLQIAWYCVDRCASYDLTSRWMVKTMEVELRGERYIEISYREPYRRALIPMDEFNRLLSELNVYRELFNKTRLYGISKMSVTASYNEVCEDRLCFVEKGRTGQVLVVFEYR
ncbi:MAG: hypothetical protein QW196_05650, partial [Sulfolobales archaeon]